MKKHHNFAIVILIGLLSFAGSQPSAGNMNNAKSIQDSLEVEKWAKAYIAQFLKGDTIDKELFHTPANIVPDKETAIAIAVSVWKPIYGEKQIAEQKPYIASLVGDYWVVAGSLPKDWLGGTAHAIISKRTGEVVHVIHYK